MGETKRKKGKKSYEKEVVVEVLRRDSDVNPSTVKKTIFSKRKNLLLFQSLYLFHRQENSEY
jgi:hypothetical protein